MNEAVVECKAGIIPVGSWSGVGRRPSQEKVYLGLYRRGQDAERALRRLATVLFTEKRPENDSTDLFGRISIDLMRCKGMVEAEEPAPSIRFPQV